eukprot:4631988-Prymnesium_polylepis.1
MVEMHLQEGQLNSLTADVAMTGYTSETSVAKNCMYGEGPRLVWSDSRVRYGAMPRRGVPYIGSMQQCVWPLV